jgi:hypothetical protein
MSFDFFGLFDLFFFLFSRRAIKFAISHWLRVSETGGLTVFIMSDIIGIMAVYIYIYIFGHLAFDHLGHGRNFQSDYTPMNERGLCVLGLRSHCQAVNELGFKCKRILEVYGRPWCLGARTCLRPRVAVVQHPQSGLPLR